MRIIDNHLDVRYGTEEGASAYRNKYRKSWARRLSNRREQALVSKALDRVQPRGPILDCPCGAGRMTPELARSQSPVMMADLSEAMVLEAQKALGMTEPQFNVNALVTSAASLCFRSHSFDTVVCHRLIHHIGEPSLREEVLQEAARVARNAVVISFSDADTMKARSRRFRGKTSARHMLHYGELKTEAARVGLREAFPPMRLQTWTSLVAVAMFRVEAS